MTADELKKHMWEECRRAEAGDEEARSRPMAFAGQCFQRLGLEGAIAFIEGALACLRLLQAFQKAEEERDRAWKVAIRRGGLRLVTQENGVKQ